MFETPLNAEEVRVLGCLIEKQITTPEYYPMTLNALVAACNQRNNRSPLVAWEERTVVRGIDQLRERRLVSMVTEAGARVPKYRHNAAEMIGLDERDIAVLCELLVRGPQTVGELKNRAERMFAFPDLAAVQTVLDGLMTRPHGALVTKLPRQPGTKEGRYGHLLAGAPAAVDESAPTVPDEPARQAVQAEEARIAKLEAETVALRQELDALKQQFEAFRKAFE